MAADVSSCRAGPRNGEVRICAQSDKLLDMTEPHKRLLLFDIDGTLVHSGGAGVHALKSTFSERFVIEDDLDDIEIAGMTDSGCVVGLRKMHHLHVTNLKINAL